MKRIAYFLIFAIVMMAVVSGCNVSASDRGSKATVQADTTKTDGSKPKQVYYGKKAKDTKKSVQCCAETSKGTRCTRKTTSESGLCWQHDPSHPSNAGK